MYLLHFGFFVLMTKYILIFKFLNGISGLEYTHLERSYSEMCGDMVVVVPQFTSFDIYQTFRPSRF